MPRESFKPSASARNGTVFSPTKSALKSPVKLPLNNDKEEKSVRFKSRQALQEIQMNSLKAAVATPRQRQSLSQTASPHTPAGDQENDDHLDSVAGNAVTPMKRVPILANFEEWMKMATDNKINANNSWNFALIDYFHDMSLLREGDSVNFQKASCTLDGCVKIYTSRVDSVATETGKLLSGLADSNNKKKRGDDDDDRDEDDNDGEEEGEDGVKRRPRKRVQRSSEATLAPSFAQLQLKKMDLEFSVDPLFKKATADFDEGGAKGLLLNHLTIDAHGRIVFDSSDDVQDVKQDEYAEDDDDDTAGSKTVMEDEQEHNRNAPELGVDLDALATRFFPDLSKLDDQEICPSLKTFELGGATGTLDIPFLKADEHWKQDVDEPEPVLVPDTETDAIMTTMEDDGNEIGAFGFAEGIGFGEGGEAWAREAAIETQGRPFDADLDINGDDGDHIGEPGTGAIGTYEADGAAYGVTLSQTHDPESILSYFDKALSKDWAGPEHWRIRKIKDVASKAPAPRQRKEKEPFAIDFSAPMTRSLSDALYTPAASASAISLPKAQWRSKTRNLLPDDKHFNSQQLLRLFLKPKARIGARRAGQTAHHRSVTHEDPHADMDHAFWAQRHAEAADAAAEQDGALAVHGNYDADFFQDDNMGPGVNHDEDDGEEFADAREAFSPGAGEDTGMPLGGIDGMMNGDAAHGAEGGFGSQLVTQSRRLRPEYVQYARVAKKVDVRRLKEEMWKGMGFTEDCPTEESPSNDQPVEKPTAEQGEALQFTKVMNGLQTVYPSQAMADISTSFCFICLLHLANEKGLVLQNEEQGRFEEIQIRRDWSAELTAGDA